MAKSSGDARLIVLARAAMAALLFSTTCVAQTGAPVARPEVKVDDRWIYRRMDHRFEPPVLLYELRVSFIDARAIHAVLSRQGKPADSDATFTPDWNGVVAVDEGIYETRAGLLQFPLSVGRTYPASWDIRRPRMGKFHTRHERSVKVIGWEEIEVPAGKFTALKLVAEGRWLRLDGNKPSGWARNTLWYVPEVKRWVKTLYEDAQGKVGEELVFYVVQ